MAAHQGTAASWERDDDQTDQGQADVAARLFEDRRSRHGRSGDGGGARRDRADRPDQHALAEHLASKDIFHEYALDYAKKVNDMTGGELKIEVLPAGAVVPAFGLLDAVSKGVLDGGHGVLVYHYGKQTALALWGSGPGFAMDANMLLSLAPLWRRQELLAKLYESIGANVVSFPYGPMPTQPFGWFKKPIAKAEDLKGLKYRTVGISIDVFTAMGAAVTRSRAAKSFPPWTVACSMRPSSTTPRPTASSASPTSQGLHAAELSPERRAVRNHLQQGQIQRIARQDEGHHRQRGGRSFGRYVVEGGRPLFEGLHRDADQGQREVLQDARRHPEAAARGL
jgi:hypothetical protein